MAVRTGWGRSVTSHNATAPRDDDTPLPTLFSSPLPPASSRPPPPAGDQTPRIARGDLLPPPITARRRDGGEPGGTLRIGDIPQDCGVLSVGRACRQQPPVHTEPHRLDST